MNDGHLDAEHGEPCEQPLHCPTCGRFSAKSWETGATHTPNGLSASWGGTCIRHGEWSDSI